ncbi:MAG TPA: DNA primase [Thermodesulfobacteriota bacterium]
MAEFITDEVIEEIRQRADIIEVISDYVTLKKAGTNYKGLCPFHQEKTPSFTVSQEKQLFHCFGCGIGGNIFTFFMKYEQVAFAEAARALAQRYGITIPAVKVTAQDQRKENLRQINAVALDFYVRELKQEKEGKVARGYLERRGIERALWEEYGIGYAPARWDALVSHLKKKGVNLKEAEALGLIIPKKGGWYDRFRDRIIFPIFDLRDRVIGFGGRILNDGSEPKYLNSPDSPLYKKGAGFYGLNVARKSIQKAGGKVFIVEGYFDLLSMAQKGVKNVVATLGTALTPEQARLARRFGKEFFLLFDPDEAGAKAALRGVEIFMQEETFATVVPLPDGLDPDAYFQKGSDAEALWSKAISGVEYTMERLMAGHDLGAVEGRAKAVGAVLPFLLRIKDGVSRDLYLKRLAEKTGVGEAEIRDAALTLHKGHKEGVEQKSIPGINVSAEKKLVQMMIQHPTLIPLVIKEGVIENLENQALRSIGALVIHTFQRYGDLSLDRIAPQLEERGVSETAFALAFQEEGLEEGMAERIMVDCLRKIKMKTLKRQMEGLKKRIKEAEAQGDEALLNSLFLSMNALSPQIRKLQGDGLKDPS